MKSVNRSLLLSRRTAVIVRQVLAFEAAFKAEEKKATLADKEAAIVNTGKPPNAFSCAATAGKLIRTSLGRLLKDNRDHTVTNRLMKRLMQVVTQTPGNSHKEKLHRADLTILKGFQFNSRSPSFDALPAMIAFKFDRDKGKYQVDISSFNPMYDLNAPKSANHFQFVAAAIEFDFVKGTYQGEVWESAKVSCSEIATAPIELIMDVSPKSELPVFLVVGMKFYREMGTAFIPISHSQFQLLEILDVNTFSNKQY